MNVQQASRSDGALEATLRAGRFAVTAETSPPDAASAAVVLDRVAALDGAVDAVNVTDGSGANAHMSALAAAAIIAANGIEPVLQFTTRDRNRIALQGDLLGAAALSIPNILCLHGDEAAAGDQPAATAVRDIDSRGLMAMARQMRDEARFPSGRAIDPAPRLFIGAADAPREPDAAFGTDGLAAKVAAGADFFQTQYVFDAAMLGRYMARLTDAGLTRRAYFLIGLGPFASAKAARWMNENLHGVNVPDAIISRIAGAADERAEGRRICVELIQQFREIPGVHGVHLMGPRQERAIVEIIRAAGVRA